MALERRRLTQEIAAAVQQKIVQLGLNPGDRLPSHAQLAEDLSISIPSLREGLQILAALGIVRLEHGRGTIVGRPSIADFFGSVDSQLLSRTYSPDECVSLFAACIEPVLGHLTDLHRGHTRFDPVLTALELSENTAARARSIRDYYALLLAPLHRPFTSDIVDLSLTMLLSTSGRTETLARKRTRFVPAMRALAAALSAGDHESARVALDEQRAILESTVRAEDRLVCATGSIGGTFYTAGLEIAGALQELSSTVLRPVPTPGGVENLRLLARGEVDVALTQANLAHAARLGAPPFDDPLPDLQTIGRTHSLDLWIVTPEAMGITDLNQLAGRRVSIGTRSGYTSRVSQLLLELYGQDGVGIEQFYLSISQATDALSRGEVDVLFYFTGGMGTAISRLSESRNLGVLSIDAPIVEELCRMEPGLSPSTIASEDGRRTAQTIRVETLLVCRGDLRSSETSALWNAVLHAAKTSEILDPFMIQPGAYDESI